MSDEDVLLERKDWRAIIASAHGPEEPTTRYVLLAISLHMSVKGDSCFPSVRTLAVETALARTTIMKHLEIACQTGWLIKEQRTDAGGQGWRRMEYWADVPEAAELAWKATRKKRGPPAGPPSETCSPGDKGGPSDSENVVHQADLSPSYSPSRGLPPEGKNQGQNRPAGRPCAHCDGPLTAGHTKMAIGDVCNPCYRDYLDSKWDPAKERTA